MIKGIKLAHVVAFERNTGGIGLNNTLPWRCPEDLANFKELTTGGIVVMGYNTFKSLPTRLPGREYWVLTSHGDEMPSYVNHAKDLMTVINGAVDSAVRQGHEFVFIIGGAQIYDITHPMIDVIYATSIDVCETDPQYDAFYKLPAVETFGLQRGTAPRTSKTGVKYQFWELTCNGAINESPTSEVQLPE